MQIRVGVRYSSTIVDGLVGGIVRLVLVLMQGNGLAEDCKLGYQE